MVHPYVVRVRLKAVVAVIANFAVVGVRVVPTLLNHIHNPIIKTVYFCAIVD